MSDPTDDSLAEAFWNVAGRLRRLSRETLAPWDVAPSHYRALAVLQRHGTMRLSELSDHLHIAARSATEVVDALQERGLVARRPDLHDRRATLVELSDTGIALLRSLSEARTAGAEAFFGALSSTDRAQLTRILRKLAPPPSI